MQTPSPLKKSKPYQMHKDVMAKSRNCNLDKAATSYCEKINKSKMRNSPIKTFEHRPNFPISFPQTQYKVKPSSTTYLNGFKKESIKSLNEDGLNSPNTNHRKSLCFAVSNLIESKGLNNSGRKAKKYFLVTQSKLKCSLRITQFEGLQNKQPSAGFLKMYIPSRQLSKNNSKSMNSLNNFQGYCQKFFKGNNRTLLIQHTILSDNYKRIKEKLIQGEEEQNDSKNEDNSENKELTYTNLAKLTERSLQEKLEARTILKRKQTRLDKRRADLSYHRLRNKQQLNELNKLLSSIV